MLNVNRLRVLCEVVERGSFSAAAEALSYTQSAVSQQIATLEAEAGSTLLERGPRGIRPTATGEALDIDFVDVGPGGIVETWAWVTEPTRKHPLDHPFAFALIRLDGADTGLLHAVDAGTMDRMRTGMRVVARWKDERVGHIADLCFVPEERR